MPIKFGQWPDAKHFIFVNERTDRRVIFLIEGNCDMDECFRFVSNYPMDEISAANEHLIPISTDVFQHIVNVKVKAFNTSVAEQVMPDWLQYFTNEFGGTMRFTDTYTFHIMRHLLLTNTGELPTRGWWL